MENKESGSADGACIAGIGTRTDGVGQPPSRRKFMGQAAALGLAGGAGLSLSGCGGAEAGAITSGLFRHGVASGDPLADRVIIWTRATPDVDRPVTLRWEVASDAAFSRIAASGSVSTGMDRDYTVKVDVTGLQPGSVYYYRFIGGTESSPEGRTKTLPAAGVRQVRLAVFSCANFAAGYFHPYGEVSRRDDIIKSRGEKVSPREVENVLHSMEAVYEVAVVGVPDEVLGQAIKAYVTLKPGATLTEREVIRHCLSRLESFMAPKYVEFVDALPKTDTGKIKKTGLG